MGTGAAPPPPEDLTTTAFKDDAWLAHNPLSKYNVLEYFSRSPFYVPPRSVQDEYLVAEEQEPHLYVINRQHAGENKAVVYVLDGTVFQAATVESVLGARCDRLLWNLRDAFKEAKGLYDPLRAARSEGLRFASSDKVEHERATMRIVNEVIGKQRQA